MMGFECEEEDRIPETEGGKKRQCPSK